MNFAYYFFFNGFMERFVVASVLVLDKFCIFYFKFISYFFIDHA